MRDQLITTLYDFYYRQAKDEGRTDIDASLWSYEQAAESARGLSTAEMRVYIRQLIGKA